MNRVFLVFAAITVINWGCNKPDFDDLSGGASLSGIVLLHDSYSGSNVYVPVKNLSVYLRNSGNTNQYLYSVKTDNQGQFAFTGIDSTKEYVMDARYDSNGVRYTGQLLLNPQRTYLIRQRDTLLLDVDPVLQNGIHLVVRDYLGGYMPNASVWVFNSPAYFFADTMANAAFTIQTDIYGISNRYSLTPGDYYFRVKTRGGGTELVDEQKVTVSAAGITPVSMTVRRVPVGMGNGIDIQTIKQGGGPEANSRLFFYKNYDVYIQDSVNCQLSSFQLVSGQDGHASAYIINPGDYFAWARKIVAQGDTLRNRDHHLVAVGNSIISDVITLK